MEMTSAQTQDVALEAGAENVSRGERMASLLAGAWMVARGVLRLRRGPWSLLTLLAGIPLVRRGLTGHSTLYQMLGIDTQRGLSTTAGCDAMRAELAEASVMIERPIAEVYEFWRKFENIPQFIAGIDSVTRLETGGWKWSATGMLGRVLEWETEVTQDVEHQRIAWRSRPGSVFPCEGTVEFHPLPGGTEVVVRMMYEPLAGKLGTQIARTIGIDAQRILVRDLARLKLILESRPDAVQNAIDQQIVQLQFDVTTFASDEQMVDPMVVRGRQGIAEERDATIDERADFESDQSFPASDPPQRY
jgi:uncharacterized membrane protein